MKIAVITPTRNRAGKDGRGFLSEALESVRLQDADYVHIVVDDGSSDSTRDLVLSYPHDRTVYIQREKPSGEKVTASIATNTGILAVFDPERLPLEDRKKVQGVEFVTFLHSDDLLAEGSLEKRMRALTENGSGMVYGEMFIINSEGKIVRKHDYSTGGDFPSWRKVLTIHNFPHHTLVFNRGLLNRVGLFDEKIGFGEDLDFTVRGIKEAERSDVGITRIAETAIYYRVHADTLTAFYISNGLHFHDIREVERKNIETLGDFVYVHMLRFQRRPQSYLPEFMKKTLNPLRQAMKRHFKKPQISMPYRDQFLEKIYANVHSARYALQPDSTV